MMVSKLAGLLAVAVVCYMIISFDMIGDSLHSESIMNKSLASSLASNEDSCLTSEAPKQDPGGPNKANQVSAGEPFRMVAAFADDATAT